MEILIDILAIIGMLTVVSLVVLYVILFRLENCYSYAIREFRAGADYVCLRWSNATCRGRRVLHALVLIDGMFHHWQPHKWEDSPTLRKWLHDDGYIKIGDE